MNYSALSLSVAAALLAAVSARAAAQDGGVEAEQATTARAPAESQNATRQTANVLFEKAKVYEIVFFTVKQGKQSQIFEKYLPAASPYVKRYGGKKLAMFRVIESRSDILRSKMAAIFEWPSYEAKKKLEADEQFKKIAELRQGAFAFFKAGWFAVKEDTPVAFHSDKIYEIGGATLKPTEEARKTLGEYFRISEPIKKSYGGTYPKFLAMFAPTGPKSASTYTNGMQFIVEWDSLADNKRLFADEQFKTQAAPMLKQALVRMDLVLTKILFPKRSGS